MHRWTKVAKGAGVAAMLCCVTAIVAAACSQSEPINTPVPTQAITPTRTPEPTTPAPTPAIAPTATPQPTTTPVPTPTIAPIPTPQPTVTPVPTPTPTPRPTPEPTVDSNMDRAALVALYEATGGADWSYNENWLTDAPINEWFGVHLDDNGRVSRLYLWYNELHGEIPPELGTLSSLADLHLGNNQLSGVLPPELGGLSNLTVLSLYGNELSGEVPSELGDLSNLTVLSLEDNQLSGEIPPELGDLSNLADLYLDGNQLSGEIPPELGDLSNLTVLSLEDNQLSGEIPPELGYLSNLTVLSLEDNQLSGGIPPELGDLSYLTDLYLGGNRLSGEIPPELGDLSNLEETRLWGGNQFVGCIPDGLRDVLFHVAALGLPSCEAVAEPIARPGPIPIGDIPLPEEWDGTPGIAATVSTADMAALGANGLTGTLHLIQVRRNTKVTVTLENAGPGPYAAAIRWGGVSGGGRNPQWPLRVPVIRRGGRGIGKHGRYTGPVLPVQPELRDSCRWQGLANRPSGRLRQYPKPLEIAPNKDNYSYPPTPP